MNEPTSTDLTNFAEFERIIVTSTRDLNYRASSGWRLIAIGIDRPAPNEDGSFTDNFVAILGREEGHD